MLAWWSNYKANGFSHYSLSVFAYFRSCASLTNMADIDWEAATWQTIQAPSVQILLLLPTLQTLNSTFKAASCIYFLPHEMKA